MATDALTREERQVATILSLIMSLCDLAKRSVGQPGTMRYRRLHDLEIRACNLVNDWRQMSFDAEDLQAAGDICDMVEEQIQQRF